MSFLSILKTIGKDIIGVEVSPIGRALTTGLIGAFAPEALPLTNMGLNLLSSSVNAVSSVEVAYKDKTGTPEQKAAEAQVALTNSLHAIQDGFAEFGYTMTIPPDELKKLNDLTVAVMNQIQNIKTLIVVTKTP
jgi:hypothetical protein